MICDYVKVKWLNLRRDFGALGVTFGLPIGFFTIFVGLFGSLPMGGGDQNEEQRLVELCVLDNDQSVAITPDGHYAGPPGVEEKLVYVVETDKGQDTLTPAEFSKQYGWKNDPSRVWLFPPDDDAEAEKPDQAPPGND